MPVQLGPPLPPPSLINRVPGNQTVSHFLPGGGAVQIDPGVKASLPERERSWGPVPCHQPRTWWEQMEPSLLTQDWRQLSGFDLLSWLFTIFDVCDKRRSSGVSCLSAVTWQERLCSGITNDMFLRFDRISPSGKIQNMCLWTQTIVV